MKLDESFVLFDSMTDESSSDPPKPVFLTGTVLHDKEMKKYFTSICYNTLSFSMYNNYWFNKIITYLHGILDDIQLL